MADHVEAIPSKSTGTTPRGSRARRTTGSSPKSTLSAPSVATKRKNRYSETQTSKYSRLETDNFESAPGANRGFGTSAYKSQLALNSRQLRKRTIAQARSPTRRTETSSDSEEEVPKTDKNENSESSSTEAQKNPHMKSSSKPPKGFVGSQTFTTASGGGNSSGRNTRFASTVSTSQSSFKAPPKNSNLRTKASTTSVPTSTSEEESRAEPNKLQTITSRLRPTASRAAAASQQRSLSTVSSSSSLNQASSPLKDSPTPKPKPNRLGKQARFTRKKQSPPPVAVGSTESSTAPTTETNTDTEADLFDAAVAGPSSRIRSSYQLRSRPSTETKITTKTTSSKDKHNINLDHATGVALRSAHILSEKERNLRRKGHPKDGPSNHTTGSQSNTARNVSEPSTSTTGSCASSRCGRGAGPSSEATGGPLNNKAGEPGMSSQAPGAGQSTSTGQGTSTSTAAEGTTTSSAANGASTSASNRAFAMLVDPDGEEGEMGRLQALLEARGLPPHLFGSLAPRMQQLLNRGMSNSTVTKAQQLLQGLQSTGDEGQQLQAAIEICQLLVMGNEDTLAGFPIKQTVPALITLLSMEQNFDMMNHACRALTYMMEALPRSTPIVAEAVPVFLEKLQVIQCMDVAEQSLTALEMLSRRHAKTILQARGVSACLTYLDFFSITAQRAALAITANCCHAIHADEFHLVADSLGFLASRLTQQDKKSVESVCLTFSRLVDSVTNDPKRLEEIASAELLANLQQLLVVTPSVVSTGTFILVLRMLAQLCARCPSIAAKLLEQNIVGTLSSLLLGSTNVNTELNLDEVELVPRNPQELMEIVALIAELLPKLPKDGIFLVNTLMTNPHLACQDAIQWQWRDDRGIWNSYSSFDSRLVEAAHQSGEDEITLTLQGRTYTVDFLGMQQVNEDTGTARTVQRKLNPLYNSTKAGGDESGQEKEMVDPRAEYLVNHSDFALPFLRPLFALLSEANSSSAGPTVRQGCVKTLLRIVHFLPAESLQKSLKPQTVSNNLASMLGACDLKIVIGAFQLSTIFMEKLHDVFSVHFRREGVFHQISRLSTSEVVGPSPIKSEMASLLGFSGPGKISSVPSVISNMPSTSFPGPFPYLHFSNPFSHAHGSAQIPIATGVTSMPSLNIPSLANSGAALHQPPDTPPFNLCVSNFFPTGDVPGSAGTPNIELDAQLTSVEPQKATLQSVSLPHAGESSNIKTAHSNGPPTKVANISKSSTKTHVGTIDSLTANSSRSSSSVGESSNEKAQDEGLMDPFKRKRLAKRPIPTSSSRRHLRQEDPAGGVAALPTLPAAHDLSHSSSKAAREKGSSSGAAIASSRRSGKSGFFASLNPSRWTRGSTAASSSANNNNNAPSTSQSTASHGSHSTPHSSSTGSHGSSGLRGHSSQAFLAISCKEQAKSWLKEQSVLFSQKYCKESGDSSSSTSHSSTGISVLPKLGEIITNLKRESKMLEALKELRTILVESDISSFEINHSGLIAALLGFMVDEAGYTSAREQRLRSFINTFADCPLDELSGEQLDSCLIRNMNGNALSLLVAKLNSCFSQLEQFQVKVHEVPTSGSSRIAPSSALRFFNTHQLKCVLQRHPSCTTLRQWKGGPVKIDPLALVQAIERYLIVRGFGRVRESRDSGDSDEDNSDEDIDDSLAAVVISQGNARHKLQFLIGDHVLPYNMTVYQAIRQFGSASSDPGADLEAEFDPASALLGSSGVWAQTHSIYYRPVPEDGTSNQPQAPAKSSSKKSKSPIIKPSSKSKKDPVWHDGIATPVSPPYLPYLTAKLPDHVTIADPSLPVLALLRVLHAVVRFWRSLYWPVLPGAPLLPLNEFINTKVAAKAQRQLQDPVVIMTGNVPSWLQQIGLACPFLFPFETRQMLFYSVSFDRDRALQRLLDSVPELNSTEREDRVTPRLDRRKRTISRDQILAQAEQVMQELSSTKPLLEIQYENEVGTGLGPTLEFYALVSQELQKRELDLWHSESYASIGDDAVEVKSKSYVHTNVGLFPKPLGKSTKAAQVTKIKSKFKFLGRFMAKAVMDSRMIDLPLSKAQYKWILAQEPSMSLADVADVDATVAQSIRKLVGVVSEKKRMERKSGLSPTELSQSLETLTLDGCRIDNLGLDFTLPGHPGIELRKGGKDIPVTIHNLEEYIKLVCHWMLVGGVSRQMEAWREGFDSVFPSSSLKMFYPEELEMIFCGADQSVGDTWDFKTLLECCRPDHGYTSESRAIHYLFEIISSYDAQERRKFVQFVTGSPRLPVGGFKSLQPPLTIVRKTVEPPADADAFLPSVMTCVNYLKLPAYTTKDIMRERLRVAAEEGQMSFHLS